MSALATILDRALDDSARTLKAIDDTARALADQMSALHGGKWNIKVNHERCLVLIAREIGRAA